MFHRHGVYSTLAIALLICFCSFTYSQEPDPRVQQAQEDLQKIGLAIERFYQDKGMLLVDLQDGSTPEGIERIQTVFEGAGMPQDGLRTLRDVYQPLVHFGYLDSIPTDPFIPADAPPEWDTYVYADQDEAIPGDDTDNLLNLILSKMPDHDWIVVSPGEFGLSTPNLHQKISITRYDVYMLPTYADALLEQSRRNMRTIGEAIEKLRSEKGVLLVDFWDDDTAEGQTRLSTVFEGAGYLPEMERTYTHVFEPLIHFGYLDSIPLDPIKVPYGYIPPGGENSYGQYLYLDDDPLIDGTDYGFFRDELNEGEWVLIGYIPYPDGPFGLNPEHAIRTFTFSSRDLLSDSGQVTGVQGWDVY